MYPLRQKPIRFKSRLWLHEDGRIIVQNGLIKAKGVPAGFLMMSRTALEKMCDAYRGELAYEARPEKKEKWRGHDVVALHHMVLEDKTYVREDIAFGLRWAKIGDGIWIDPDIELKHVDGNNFFTGNYREWLVERSEKSRQERIAAGGGEDADEPQGEGEEAVIDKGSRAVVERDLSGHQPAA
jgi:hypothetical protein